MDKLGQVHMTFSQRKHYSGQPVSCFMPATAAVMAHLQCSILRLLLPVIKLSLLIDWSPHILQSTEILSRAWFLNNTHTTETLLLELKGTLLGFG